MGISADNVVGGIGKPKFLILTDYDYCENPIFENGDETGWTSQPPETLDIQNISNFYGDYRGYLSGSNDIYDIYTAPVSLEYPSQLIISLYYFAAETIKYNIRIEVLINNIIKATFTPLCPVWTVFQYPRWLRFVGICNTEISGTIKVRVYCSHGGFERSLCFTKLMIRDAKEIYQLSEYPTKQTEVWEPDYLYDVQTLIGNRREGKRGEQHLFHAHWKYMTKEDEEKRSKLMDARPIFVIPHDDVDFGVLTAWDKSIKREWAKNKAVAHQGDITLRSTELLERVQVLDPS